MNKKIKMENKCQECGEIENIITLNSGENICESCEIDCALGKCDSCGEEIYNFQNYSGLLTSQFTCGQCMEKKGSQKMNAKIKTLLVDEKLTREFLDITLPELKEDEVLLLMMFARKKYNSATTDEWKFFRDVVKPSKSRGDAKVSFSDVVLRKIRRSAVFVGDYTDFKTGELIPMDAFVYYIDLTPKSMLKAYTLFTKETADLLYRIYKDTTQIEFATRLKTKFLSAIHKSNSYKPYSLLDIDDKDEDLLEKCLDVVNNEYIWVSETRGGYHVIVEKTKENGRSIHENIRKDQQNNKNSIFKDVEIKKEVMTPVPGTLQGGFMVKRWK